MTPTAWHHLTVDVEEFFQVTALEKTIPRSAWDQIPRRAPGLVEGILDQFSQSGTRATFFVLGWLAEREPEMVRDIAAAGHEIACHGWDHRLATSLSPTGFREDVRRSREILEDTCGCPVRGYRAPSFSIKPGFEWALDVLLELGFSYDSSLFPIRVHPGYGYPDAPAEPHTLSLAGGHLWEIPPATLQIAGLRLPAAGGAYLRFFPGLLVRSALMAAARRGLPGTLYFHPWEMDVDMPRFRAPLITRVRMRTGLNTMARKLAKLTAEFSFRPIRETVEELEEGRVAQSDRGGPAVGNPRRRSGDHPRRAL